MLRRMQREPGNTAFRFAGLLLYSNQNSEEEFTVGIAVWLPMLAAQAVAAVSLTQRLRTLIGFGIFALLLTVPPRHCPSETLNVATVAETRLRNILV